MTYQSDFWQQRAFPVVMIACALFVVLTIVAMFFYPGGTVTDPTTVGYSFFGNFFSDLGLTKTGAGDPNTVSAILFVIALTSAGGGLALFFVAFRQFFARSLFDKLLSGIGSIFGVISGLCFIGVAFTPANLYMKAHGQFVMRAFQTFTIAVIFYIVVVFREREYPNRFAFVFVVFAVLLVFYLQLMMNGLGMDMDRSTWVVVQVTGQKIIVYASITSAFIQAYGARKVQAAARSA